MKKIMALMTAVFIVVLSVSPAFAYDFGGYTYKGEEVDIESIKSYLESRYDAGYTYATLAYPSELGQGALRLFQSNVPFKVNDVNDSLYATDTMSYYKYIIYTVNSDYPYLKADGTTASSLGDNQQPTANGKVFDVLVWTSYDIKDNGGNLVMSGDSGFFPQPPLAEVIQGVTAETLTSQTVPAVTGTMKTAVLCGVGCLALLTVLVLLPKKFWMFLR